MLKSIFLQNLLIGVWENDGQAELQKGQVEWHSADFARSGCQQWQPLGVLWMEKWSEKVGVEKQSI